jgi:glycosyltransferase involved in cell wall biosynthesis
VSVVIPFYNGANFFSKALASVLNQSTQAFEIIVVDDGSSAKEHEYLIEQCSGTNVKILRTENKGQSAARNHGVEHANGDFVCFLDQDDYFLPNHISSLLKVHKQSEFRAAFTYGDAWRQAEGANAAWNPLNTTKKADNTTNFNCNKTATVKNYPDRETGLKATVDTLKSRYYADIVKGLVNNVGAYTISTYIDELTTWGTRYGVNEVLAGKTLNPPPIQTSSVQVRTC